MTVLYIGFTVRGLIEPPEHVEVDTHWVGKIPGAYDERTLTFSGAHLKTGEGVHIPVNLMKFTYPKRVDKENVEGLMRDFRKEFGKRADITLTVGYKDDTYSVYQRFQYRNGGRVMAQEGVIEWHESM